MIRIPCLLAVAAGVCFLGVGGRAPLTADDRQDAPAAAKGGGLVHVVIFYLKKDAPQTEADSLVSDAYTLLAKIPSVRLLRAGRPAEKGTEIAVKDYHVGLAMHFDDSKALEQYRVHPLHKKYVEKHTKFVDKVLIYDFLDERR